MLQNFAEKQESTTSNEFYDLLTLSLDINVQIFSLTLEILPSKVKTLDCYQFFCRKEINQHFKNYEQQFSLNSLDNDILKLRNLIKATLEHNFNKINFSIQIYDQARKQLIEKISKNFQITECLKFLVRLSAIDETFMQSSSNALNLLVEMKHDMTNQSWQNIKIKNTSLIGASFAKCNLSGSEFDNIQIDGVNLNGAQLFNCKWTNLILGELYRFFGQCDSFGPLYFFPNSFIFQSAPSNRLDQSLFLWNWKTGRLKQEFITKNRSKILFFYSERTISVNIMYDKIYLVNFRSGKRILKINGNYNYNYDSITLNDTLLGCSSEDGFIHILDLKTLTLKIKFQGHLDGVSNIYLSPDGTFLASFGPNWDDKVRLWDVQTGTLKAEIIVQNGQAISACFSPDGSIFAYNWSNKGSIRLCQVNTGELQSQLNEHSDSVSSICFNADGKILLSGSWDKSICFWDVKTGQLISKIKANDHVTSVFFSPDSNFFGFTCFNGFIYFCDLKIITLKPQLKGHTNGVNSVCFSPDDTQLASGSWDKSISIWDAKTGELKRQFHEHSEGVNTVCFSPDGIFLASGGWDKFIHLWNVKTGELKLQLNGHTDGVKCVCFSPNSMLLASCSWDKTILLWDVKTGTVKAQLNEEGYEFVDYSLHFSPNGLILASAFQSIRLWDVITGQLKLQFNKGHYVNSVCFSPDSTLLASGGPKKEVSLWDVMTGEVKFQLIGHSNGINSVCFSPNGTILASGGWDTSIRLWNLQTGELIKQLNGHTDFVSSVCFSNDGSTLASCSWDNSIRLWDVKTSEPKSQIDKYCENQPICFQNMKFENQLNSVQFESLKDRLEINPFITTVLITQEIIFQAFGAVVHEGIFQNHLGMNLKPLLEQKGSIIIENLLK